MSNIKIILAEDEPALGMIVKESLESRNFEVVHCENGELAIEAYDKEKPQALVLDIMMPKKDGFSVAEYVRKEDPFIPIIFLTAKSRTEDVVEGFGYGANDYIKKPFSMEELIVRIQALVNNRTYAAKTEEWIEIGKYRFHAQKQILKLNEEEDMLTHREAQLLEQLIIHKNELTDRTTILKKLWGSDDFFNARSMDVFISKLRKKLVEDPSIQIVNVRGYGYKLIY